MKPRKQGRRQGGGQGERSPLPKPGKFAKDEKQPTPQPAMRIDIGRKFKFSLNFSNFYYNFLKNFKNF